MHCEMLRPLLLSALPLLAASTVSGQAPTPPAAQLEAMKKFDLWVGEWKGSGWDSPGGDRRHEFRINEKVQRKLGGTVLLVEGRGTSRTDKGQEVATHESVTLLYYDDKAGRITGMPMTSAGGRSMRSRSLWTVVSNGVSGSKSEA